LLKAPTRRLRSPRRRQRERTPRENPAFKAADAAVSSAGAQNEKLTAARLCDIFRPTERLLATLCVILRNQCDVIAAALAKTRDGSLLQLDENFKKTSVRSPGRNRTPHIVRPM